MTIPHRFDTPMTQPSAGPPHPHLRRWIGLLGLSVFAGCGHSEPFGSGDYSTDQPFSPTPPVQITLNHGQDQRAAWLPDGSGILYSTQLDGSVDNDVCLALLPPTGGRQRALTCNLTVRGTELTEAFDSPAPGADARLAYVAATGQRRAVIPDLQELSLATVANPVARTRLLGLPYTIPGGRSHGGISQIHWLGPNKLLYLGEAVTVITPCNGCEKDTVRSGLDAVTLNVDGSTAAPQAIAGTDYASGVSPGGSEDEVYYTIGGDTRVFHQTLSSGAVSVAHDFGGAGVARDIHVVGDRLAAVVGGRVHYADHPALGPTQWDSGGIVYLVNLSDGAEVSLTDPTELALYRRPRISPSGNQIVVERYQMILLDIRDQNGTLIGVDTTVARPADLYLLGQP
jgi:hypothetical protein